MKWILCVAALLVGPALAQQWFHLQDPRGDDQGDGSLEYPSLDGWQGSELDVVEYSAELAGDVIWFKVTFAKPIVSPASALQEVGGQSLAYIASLGFYQFNLDSYFDLDGIADSGNAFALPGRHIRFERSSAWEKAVILTPRPALMQEEFAQWARATDPQHAEQWIASVFFPTNIRVQGKTLRYQVPKAFFQAQLGKIGLTAWITPADLNNTLKVSAVSLGKPGSTSPEASETNLGVLPLSRTSASAFRSTRPILPTPVVDLILPTVQWDDLTPHQELPITIQAQRLGSGETRLMAPTLNTSPAEKNAPLLPSLDKTEKMPAVTAPPKLNGMPPKPAVDPLANPILMDKLSTLKALRDQGLLNEQDYQKRKDQLLDRWIAQ